DDYKTEKTVEDRRPILLGGEQTETQSARSAGNTDLTTSDIAEASEQRTSAKEPQAQGDEQEKSGHEQRVGAKAGANSGEESTPLFSADESNELRSRWDAIQVGFVDEPRRAVEQADSTVATTVKRLA